MELNKTNKKEKKDKFNIALIGNSAVEYIEDFKKHNCRIIQKQTEIRKEDDIVFCLNYDQIISEKYLQLPKYGIYVNHSSDLPSGKGWAPLQWSVLHGLSKVTITLFKANTGLDSGLWAYKSKFTILKTDTINDLYKKDHFYSAKLFNKLLDAIKEDRLILKKQKGESSYWRKRTPEDSELDGNKTLFDLWNHIRICDNNRYPAYFIYNNKKIILKYEVI